MLKVHVVSPAGEDDEDDDDYGESEPADDLVAGAGDPDASEGTDTV